VNSFQEQSNNYQCFRQQKALLTGMGRATNKDKSMRNVITMSGQRQTSRLLINEAPLQVLPSLAAAIGLNEAIVLQQIHFLVGLSDASIAEDNRWAIRSMEAWIKEFPWWSVRTVKQVFANLKKRKLVISGKFNQNKWDHTLWYRIDYEALEAITPLDIRRTVDSAKSVQSDSTEIARSEETEIAQSSLLDKRDKKDSSEPLVQGAAPKPRKPNPVYDWVASTVFKVTPESAEQDKDIHKWIGANTAKLINAEKRSLGIPEKRPLTDEQRSNLAAQLPGMVKFWRQENPGAPTPPQNKPSFAKLVIQWYDAGKPYSIIQIQPKFVPVPHDDYVSETEAV
jgi:hypothetical protein